MNVHAAQTLRANETAEADVSSQEIHGDLSSRAHAVAITAVEHAADVDQRARFPQESVDALRAARLLGAMAPRELGGGDASIRQIADVCYHLGRACSATAMVFAMHQSSVACLVQHAGDSAAMARMLRMIAEKQLLVASSTTEGQAGGDLRSSAAAVEKQDAFITLDRAATVISYGAHADAILTTARRASDANKTDQVLLFVPKQNYSLTPTSGWDTLGMRGTCSQGFNLIAKGAPDMVLPASYETIHAHTMMPVSHLLWTSAWAGIAAAAVERAQRLIRKSARRAGGQTPPAASHATRAAATLRVLQATVNAGLARYERAARTPEEFETIDFQTTLNLLKVNASELAIATVMSAFQACGLSGYRNDGEFSVARQVRDILSTSIMINNDRILTNSATGALLSGVPESLTL